MEARSKNLARQNLVRVFSSSYNSKYYYPYRLAKTRKVTDTVRNSCLELIVDSNIDADDVTNEEVINEAADFHADYVIPKDYKGEIHASYRSIHEFIELWKETPGCHATIIAPLQPPYRQHYNTYEEFYSEFSHFALGGISNVGDARDQLRTIHELRDLIGRNAYLHGLGVGTNLEFIRGLRERPWLLDSLDVSTAELAVAKNGLPDKTMSQMEFEFPTGDNSSIVRGQFAQAVLHMLNFMLSPQTDDSLLTSDSKQNSLDEYLIEQLDESESDTTSETATDESDWAGGFRSKQQTEDAAGADPHTPGEVSNEDSTASMPTGVAPAPETESTDLGDF